MTGGGARRLPGPREDPPLRYAVVGGTGMIGTWLVRALRERGDEVWIVGRRPAREPGRVQWDPTRGVSQLRALDGLDVLVNLAGAPLADRPWTKQRRKVLFDSRVRATEALIASLESLERPPATYVGVSSLGLFGDRGEEWIEDDSPPGAGFFAELCTAWELAHLESEALGSRAVVLRPSVVLSPTGGVFPYMIRPFRYLGGWLGHGRQYTPWIDIRDFVRAVIHVASRPDCRGPMNATVPEPPQNKALFQDFGRVMETPVVTHAPRWALRGALGDLADQLLIASVRARPRRLLASGFAFEHTDAEATFRWLVEQFDLSVPPEPRGG